MSLRCELLDSRLPPRAAGVEAAELELALGRCKTRDAGSGGAAPMAHAH